jgi:hypothetical protein
VPRNPNLLKCNTCGSVSSTAGPSGVCPYCGAPAAHRQAAPVIDETQPLDPNTGGNAAPAAPESAPDSDKPVAPPKARRKMNGSPVPPQVVPSMDEKALKAIALARRLEGPARIILEAHHAAQAKTKKGTPTAWVKDDAVQQAIAQLDVALMTDRDRKRAALKKLLAEGGEDLDALADSLLAVAEGETR